LATRRSKFLISTFSVRAAALRFCPALPDRKNLVSKKVVRDVDTQQLNAVNPLFRCFLSINDAQ
jgi:hypothetical protein